MHDGVSRRDGLCARVYHGAVERVQHRADKLPGGAGIYPRVAVERQYIFRSDKRVSFARHLKLARLVADELCKLHYRAALALTGAVALPVEASAAGEKIKAPAVSAVQARHGLAHGADERLVSVGLGAVRHRQVGQQPEAEVHALAHTRAVQLLQPLHIGLPAEKRGYHAHSPPRLRHTGAHVHAHQPPRAHYVQQYEVDKALHEL